MKPVCGRSHDNEAERRHELRDDGDGEERVDRDARQMCLPMNRANTRPLTQVRAAQMTGTSK
jgi:hypothetical protein